MYLLLSGEGKSDLGSCDMGLPFCEGKEFSPGPISRFVDQLIEQRFEFSLIDYNCCGFVSEARLSDIAKSLLPISFPGKKKRKETAYYYKNARALAVEAQAIQSSKQDSVLAVLFRDCDGTHSTKRDDWDNKWVSILNGFNAEQFDYGVPMLPKPKSEAWLLCATKNNYQHCNQLEELSGNDDAPESLKKQLDHVLQGNTSSHELYQMIKDQKIDVNQIKMNSLDTFKNRLDEVLVKIQ